jgi:hypothetical protein
MPLHVRLGWTDHQNYIYPGLANPVLCKCSPTPPPIRHPKYAPGRSQIEPNWKIDQYKYILVGVIPNALSLSSIARAVLESTIRSKKGNFVRRAMFLEGSSTYRKDSTTNHNIQEHLCTDFAFRRVWTLRSSAFWTPFHTSKNLTWLFILTLKLRHEGEKLYII